MTSQTGCVVSSLSEFLADETISTQQAIPAGTISIFGPVYDEQDLAERRCLRWQIMAETEINIRTALEFLFGARR